MAGLGAKCVNWSLKDLHHYIFTLKLVAISLLEGVFWMKEMCKKVKL